jgi:hypothetical protein
MGGLLPDGKTPWTGGQPKPGWKGIDSKADPHPYESQAQQHPTVSKYDASGQRRTGLEVKFNKGDSIPELQRQVLKHLQKHGLKPYAWLASPTDKKQMLNVIRCHARFADVADASRAMEKQYKLYDSYDVPNDKDCCEFLLDSLERGFRDQVETAVDEETLGTRFPLLWLTVMQLNARHTSTYFEKVKQTVKEIEPSQFEGEDISKFSTAVAKAAQPLIDAGHYEHELTRFVILNYMKAGGEATLPGKVLYTAALIKFEQTYTAAMAKIHRLSQDEKDSAMTRAKTTLRDLGMIAVEAYCIQCDADQWEPAKRITDTGWVPKGFQANVLSQNLGPENPSHSEDACHNCGEKGHWARDCPKPRRSKNSERTSRGRRTGRDMMNRHFGDRTQTRALNRKNAKTSNRMAKAAQSSSKPTPGSKEWKATPPGKGQPHSIAVQGNTFSWCQLCGRWSTTHSTRTHKGPGGTAPSSTTEVNFGLLPDPSAWFTTAPAPPRPFCVPLPHANPMWVP